MSSATNMLAVLAVNVSPLVEPAWSIDTMTTPIWRSAPQGRRDVGQFDVAANQQTGTVGRESDRRVMWVHQVQSCCSPLPLTDPSS